MSLPKQFEALEFILLALDELTIEEKDVVLEAARYAGEFRICSGPTTNPAALRLIESWGRPR